MSRLSKLTLAGALALPLHAQLTYVDATDGAAGNTTLTDGSILTADDTTGATTWRQRDNAQFGSSATVFEGVDPSPEVKTTITGLTPGKLYEVYVHFWDPQSLTEDWNVRAGLESENLTLFSREGNAELAGSTAGVLASTLIYNTAPTAFGPFAGRQNIAGYVGMAFADAGGNLEVFIDDLDSTDVNLRTWYDGVSYQLVPDEDDDGLPDAFELAHTEPASTTALNPGDDLENEGAGDGLNNLAEFLAGTDPNNPDSDSDGLEDGPEVNATLNDGVTPTGYAATDPNDADSDDDGANDLDEVTGALNIQFANAATDPNNADTDGDGMPDGYELTCNSSPATALDPNDDGAGNPAQAQAGDRDGDTLTNFQEFDPTTGPNGDSPQTRADLADTDDDGFDDNVEDNFGSWDSATLTGTNPVIPDTDGDGLLDGDENLDLGSYQGSGVTPAWSDPNIVDTDNDQFSDGYEVNVAGTDPNSNSPGDIPTQPSGWTLLEDFEGPGMALGQTYKGVNGWQSDDDASGMLVADEPLAGGDQVGGFIRPVGGNNLLIYKSLSELGLQILDGNSGTIFLQLYTPAAGLDHSLGLSDAGYPGWFTDFEAQTALVGTDPTVIGTRGNSGFRPYAGGGYPVAEWMNIWIVADNANDELKVYYQSPAGETGQIDITADSTTMPYVFRNGPDVNPLTTFMMIENAPAAPVVYIDNLYIDPTAANLTSPAPAKPTAALDLRVTDVFFDGGDLKITFTPGGAGYILTSSDDLAAPFTQETNATFDGIDTFTVPAGSLNPGKDFFRVETP